jgi:hypothetical protein
MIRFFSENRALTAFMLPIFMVAYILLNTIFPYYETSHELDFGLFGTYIIENTIYKQIGSGVLIFLNAILLNFIFNNQNIYDKTIHLPAFIYIVWMSFFREMYNPDGFLLVHTFYILIAIQLFRLNQNEDGRRAVFNAALFAGIATCLHPTLVIILPFLFAMVWVLRPFVFRESMLIIAGFITPLIYAGVAMLFNNESFQQNWSFNMIYLHEQPYKLLIIAAIMLLFIIVSVWGMRSKLQNSSIRFRKLSRVLWLLFLLTLFLGIIDLMILQQEEYFSLMFIVLPFFSVFSFISKPVAVFANGLFVLILICSFLKFFL